MFTWKIKAVLALVGAVVFAIALYFNFQYREGRDGRLIFVAPLASGVSATLDGAPLTLAPGEVRRMSVAHGEHQLVVTAPAPLTRRFVIDSGRNPRVVPVLAQQCYEELDVTTSHYGGGGVPLVSRVVQHDEIWITLDGLAFTETELPESATVTTRGGRVTDVQLVQLWRPIPCALGDQPESILRLLGYIR